MSASREQLIRILQEAAAAGSTAGQLADRILSAQGDRYRHLKRGTSYTLIGQAALQSSGELVEGALLVVYRGEDGRMWARPYQEFYDGRFVKEG